MLQTENLLSALSKEGAAFVIIGGMAAVAQGSSYVTADLDICYRRQPDNYARIIRALLPFHPLLRDAPADFPFVLDAPTLKAGFNFTLTTQIGDIDLLGEVAGLGDYEKVRAYAEEIELYGFPVQVLNLEGLIISKQAAGRPKDVRLLPELKALQALQDKPRKP